LFVIVFANMMIGSLLLNTSEIVHQCTDTKRVVSGRVFEPEPIHRHVYVLCRSIPPIHIYWQYSFTTLLLCMEYSEACA